MVTIAIRRINNVYQLQVFIELGFSAEKGNMWYGSTRPAQKLMNNYDTWINTEEEIRMISREGFTEYFDDEEPEAAVNDDLWFGGGD